jgi:glycine betaine/proline transport system ATP-binding protein
VEFLETYNFCPKYDDIVECGMIGAVRDVTLDVHLGEIFVIMGLSGSGKSTLVRCMSRLIEPTSGQIIFDDMDLLKATEREMIEIHRHKMGMVFQHFGLLPHKHVLDNVAFPLEVQRINKKKRRKKAREMIELVGLSGREKNFPAQLSGGEQQRVGIARSLVVEPEIWFLDEPFSALDPLIRSEMQEEFLNLQRMLHKTIVFITHDFDEAIRLADRIAIMKDGEIVQIGTPEELVTNPQDDYVREFTQKVPREKVLSASSIMQPTRQFSNIQKNYDNGFISAVASDMKVMDLALPLINYDKPVGVTDPDGKLIGKLTRKSVIKAFFGRSS